MAGLSGRKIAILATDRVEQVELTEPLNALKAVSAEVIVIAPKSGQIQGMNHAEKADKLEVNHDLSSVQLMVLMRWCCRVAWRIRMN